MRNVPDAFQFPDRSIRTDLLLDRLAEAAQNAGAELRSGEPVERLLYQPTSVFGTSRWVPVRHGEDQQVIPEETDHLWNHVERLFPVFQRHDHGVTEWAGTAVQAMQIKEIQAAQIPQPIVIDHQQESDRVENLISAFPGRATLWAHVAEETCSLVRAMLGQREREIARPPWGATCCEGSESSSRCPQPLD